MCTASLLAKTFPRSSLFDSCINGRNIYDTCIQEYTSVRTCTCMYMYVNKYMYMYLKSYPWTRNLVSSTPPSIRCSIPFYLMYINQSMYVYVSSILRLSSIALFPLISPSSRSLYPSLSIPHFQIPTLSPSLPHSLLSSLSPNIVKHYSLPASDEKMSLGSSQQWGIPRVDEKIQEIP